MAMSGAEPRVEEHALTHLSIGMWFRKSRSVPAIWLLIQPHRRRFVFLVEQRRAPIQSNARKLGHMLRNITASPFHSRARADGSYAVAFEVDWAAIVGIDYSNPLCQDGRLVLEARRVVKREFGALKEARNYYCPSGVASPSTPPSSTLPQPAGAHALAPAAPAAAGLSGTAAAATLACRNSQRAARACAASALGQPAPASPWAGGQRLHSAARVLDMAGPACEQPAQQAAHHPAPSVRPGEGAGAPVQKASDRFQPAQLAPGSAEQPSGAAAVPSTVDLHAHAGGSVLAAELGSKQGVPAGSGASDVTNKQHASRLESVAADQVAAQSRAASTAQPARQLSLQRSLSSPDLPYTPLDGPTGGPPSAAGGAACGSPAGGAAWPSAAAWTLSERVYEYRTIAVYFADPLLPVALRPAVQGDERLLKLYETGLPAWAIYMPAYGLYYRPFLRTITWLLFIAVSVLSLFFGFWDLYKNVPYLDQVVRRMLASVRLPVAAIFDWLEQHASIRLSILLTYLFGKSALLHQLVRWLGSAAFVLRSALAPVAAVLGPPLSAAGVLLRTLGTELSEMAAAVAAVLAAVAAAVFGPPARAVCSAALAIASLLARVVLPVYQVLKAAVSGPWSVCVAMGQAVVAGAAVAWQGARTAGTAARALGATLRVAPAAQASMAQAGGQAAWWAAVPGEALDVVRASGLKVLRALQTLMRFLIQVCCDVARHRLTLTLRLHRWWRRARAAARRALVTLPAACLAAAAAWLRRAARAAWAQLLLLWWPRFVALFDPLCHKQADIGTGQRKETAAQDGHDGQEAPAATRGRLKAE